MKVNISESAPGSSEVGQVEAADIASVVPFGADVVGNGPLRKKRVGWPQLPDDGGSLGNTPR